LNVRFLVAARDELRETISYYEDVRPGLGTQFRDEIYATIRRIEHHPEAWSRLSTNTRRCRTSRFPYGVIYQVDEDDLIVVAIAHLHREPGYWRSQN
jgi:plasmid stabilization system protein ParE